MNILLTAITGFIIGGVSGAYAMTGNCKTWSFSVQCKFGEHTTIISHKTCEQAAHECQNSTLNEIKGQVVGLCAKSAEHHQMLQGSDCSELETKCSDQAPKTNKQLASCK